MRPRLPGGPLQTAKEAADYSWMHTQCAGGDPYESIGTHPHAKYGWIVDYCYCSGTLLRAPPADPQHNALDATSATMEAVSLNDPAQPTPLDHGVAAAAGNQWTSFTLQLRDLPAAEGYWIRAHDLQLDNANANIALSHFEPAQILPMPVDLDRAGYVRHTGLSTAGRNLPRIDPGTI